MLISNSGKTMPYYQEFGEHDDYHGDLGSTLSTNVSESQDRSDMHLQPALHAMNPVYPRRSRQERRKREYTHDRDFVCGCGKDYLSYGALFTHSKFNHNLILLKGTKIRMVRLGWQVILSEDQPARSCVASTEFYKGERSALDPTVYDPKNTSGTATGIYSAAMLTAARSLQGQNYIQAPTSRRHSLQLPAECFIANQTAQAKIAPKPTANLEQDQHQLLQTQYYYMHAGTN